MKRVIKELETSSEFAHSSVAELNKKVEAQDKAIRQLQDVKSITKQINEAFERVHRIGKSNFNDSKPRSFIVKFTFHKDKELV